jgi:hypothetical protein
LIDSCSSEDEHEGQEGRERAVNRPDNMSLLSFRISYVHSQLSPRHCQLVAEKVKARLPDEVASKDFLKCNSESWAILDKFILLEVEELGRSVNLVARPCDLLSPEAVNYLFGRCVQQQMPALELENGFQTLSEDQKSFVARRMTMFALEAAVEG